MTTAAHMSLDDAVADAERMLEASIDAKSARCCVVGLGYIGTSVARALLAAGFEVRAYDRSRDAADRFAGTVAHRRILSVGTRDDDALADADVIHVAVSIPCLDRAKPDLDPLAAVAGSLRGSASRPRLVIVHSTIPPGATRRLAEACREGTTTFVAHCPERLQPGNDAWTIANTPHVVAGVNEPSGRLALRMLRQITQDVMEASAPEVTELAKLMENAFIAVGVALAGEFTRLAHAVGVTGTEVARAAATKPFSYYSFFPGPGVGGHCIPNDLAMLASLRDGVEAPLLAATDATLAQLPGLITGQVRRCIEERGAALRPGMRILLVGVGFKVGSSDTTNTPARDLVRLLRGLGATPAYLDEGVESFAVDERPVERARLDGLAAQRFGAAVILSGSPGVTGDELVGVADVVLDASGGRAFDSLPSSVERL